MVYWSRFQFNPQTLVDSEWIDDHGLLTMGWMEPTDQYEKRVMLFIEESIRNKLRIRELFEAEVGIHFRRAAAICEMSYVGDFEDIMTVTKSVHMSNSIANDPSADNVERLCWIMYCSSNTVHKKVFGMEMNDHFEVLLMQQLGVSYKDDDKGVKGCVSKYYNKMLNDFRTDVKGGMASIAHCVIAKVSSNKPDDVVDASPKAKKDSPVFWIGTKTTSQRSLQTIIWKKVSNETYVLSRSLNTDRCVYFYINCVSVL